MSKKIHFIGIGGIGMSGIAQLCIRKGHRVSGSDLKDSLTIRKLKQLGIEIFIGHKKENIKKDLDFAVYSTAIKPDNQELTEANKLGVAVIRRAEMLAELMKEHAVIAVTGAHGKTTTSSLLSHVLIEAQLCPTVAVGGVIQNICDNAALGNGVFFVAEADESDGTFLLYKPKHSIVTNIDYEHMDFYSSFDEIKKAFKEFIEHHRQDGCVFWCYDDKNLSKIIKETKINNISFGLIPEADVYAKNVRLNDFSSAFEVFVGDKLLGEFMLPLVGRHNIYNALSVIALAMELGIDIEQIKKSISSFLGVERRFQIKYNSGDILVVDDYAHHPTEIKATINAAKGCGLKRLLVIFQPHRYSRMKHLFNEFSKSFFQADNLFLTEIYPAGEKNTYDIKSQHLYEEIKKSKNLQIELVEKKFIKKHILKNMKQGDLVLFLGAGDINRISDELVKDLQRKD